MPLPDDFKLAPEIRKRLAQLPALNNLRMFANVPQCFFTITDLINELFNKGTIDPKLREFMYLRIAIKYAVLYEYRHNMVFAQQLGITPAEIEALHTDGLVNGLGDDGNLVCRAAEEITETFSVSDQALAGLLDRFGQEGASEIILLVSWFNMLIRYVELTRTPYEDDPAAIIKGGGPLALEQQ